MINQNKSTSQKYSLGWLQLATLHHFQNKSQPIMISGDTTIEEYILEWCRAELKKG